MRAPYKKEVLVSVNNNVLKAEALNLSENGLLLKFENENALGQEVTCMLEVLKIPIFKNYTLDRLNSFSFDKSDTQTVRFQARSVREKVERERGLFLTGFSIVQIDTADKLKITKYIESMLSNLISLQVLIDSYASDSKQMERISLISYFLGYKTNTDLPCLQKAIEHDYKSLQWL